MSQYMPTRYKVLCIIDKRCRVRNYVEVRRGIIRVAQGSGPCSCIRVAITTREVSAVTETDEELVKYFFPIYFLGYKDTFLKAALDTLPPH